MFDATAAKYRDVQFERVELTSGDPRIAQYNVTAIPRAVFLDSGNKVLYNGDVWGDPDGFGMMIKSPN